MQFAWNGRMYSGFLGPNGRIYRSFDELAAAPWFTSLMQKAIDRQRAAMQPSAPAPKPKRSVLERAFEHELARAEAEAEAAHWQRSAQLALLKRKASAASAPEDKLRFLLQQMQLETNAQPVQAKREPPVMQQPSADPADALRRMLERWQRVAL